MARQYIDKTGNVMTSRPLHFRLYALLVMLWQSMSLFFVTLLSPSANRTALDRQGGGYRLGGDNSGHSRGSNSSSRTTGTMAGLRSTGSATRGLYGEAPCCGR